MKNHCVHGWSNISGRPSKLRNRIHSEYPVKKKKFQTGYTG